MRRVSHSGIPPPRSKRYSYVCSTCIIDAVPYVRQYSARKLIAQSACRDAVRATDNRKGVKWKAQELEKKTRRAQLEWAELERERQRLQIVKQIGDVVFPTKLHA